MCVKWLATVRSPRKSAVATSRFVRPSATSTATRRSDDGQARLASCARRCFRARSRAFALHVAAPSSSNAAQRRCDRVAGSSASAAARRRTIAECQERAGATVGISDALRAARPPAQKRLGLADRPARGSDEPAATRRRARAPTRGRPASRPPPTRRSAEARRRSRPSSSSSSAWSPLHQRTLGSPHPSSAARRPGPVEPLAARGRVPAPQRSEPQDPPGAAAGGARTASPPARALVRNARARAPARRGGRR